MLMNNESVDVCPLSLKHGDFFRVRRVLGGVGRGSGTAQRWNRPAATCCTYNHTRQYQYSSIPYGTVQYINLCFGAVLRAPACSKLAGWHEAARVALSPVLASAAAARAARAQAAKASGARSALGSASSRAVAAARRRMGRAKAAAAAFTAPAAPPVGAAASAAPTTAAAAIAAALAENTAVAAAAGAAQDTAADVEMGVVGASTSAAAPEPLPEGPTAAAEGAGTTSDPASASTGPEPSAVGPAPLANAATATAATAPAPPAFVFSAGESEEDRQRAVAAVLDINKLSRCARVCIECWDCCGDAAVPGSAGLVCSWWCVCLCACAPRTLEAPGAHVLC